VTQRIVRIEKLAPTGEGIARTDAGVGFVEGALPGELVATNVYQVKKKFWRGRVAQVLEASPERVEGPHADCAGCDWAYFDDSAARRAKRELFQETMMRLGHLDLDLFGDLPVEASGPGYRLRLRLHAAGGRIGYYAPGTHRVVSAGLCEAIAPATRALFSPIEEALAEPGAEAQELAILEDVAGETRVGRVTMAGVRPPEPTADLASRLPGFSGVRVLDAEGKTLHERGDASLDLSVNGRLFHVSVDTFFQSNRHLVGPLAAAVAEEARRLPAGLALDAFGGVGLFAGALLDAGHRVVSVEADPAAADDAAVTFGRWGDGAECEAVRASVADFLARDGRRYGCVVADPPRAGLGKELAAELAARAERAFVYVSCDSATLARDLPVVLAEGFAIRRAVLFDLFAYTHRVEALVSLERVA
jgi:tRNA/tmRNA/rRNA uracil-C5-methylase (TrmA/RlmC/RlmD family)